MLQKSLQTCCIMKDPGMCMASCIALASDVVERHLSISRHMSFHGSIPSPVAVSQQIRTCAAAGWGLSVATPLIEGICHMNILLGRACDVQGVGRSLSTGTAGLARQRRALCILRTLTMCSSRIDAGVACQRQDRSSASPPGWQRHP